MITVIIPDIIMNSIDEDEVEQLIEAIKSFADIGLIDADENNEVNVTAQIMQDIIIGTRNIRDAIDTYGEDIDGLVKYPFSKAV